MAIRHLADNLSSYMQIAYETLRILNDGKFHSGTSLAETLGVSRSSVWKGIQFLRQLAVEIQAVPGRGYRWYLPMELLDKKTLFSFLDPAIQKKLPRVDMVNVVGSTNDYLLQRLSHNIPSGTVCVAEAQTAGKGRMGRKWHSPFGTNIYLSLYWRFPNRLHDLSGLSLVIGLAVLDALATFATLPPEMGIKWPNDIWVGGSKLCGILVESISGKDSQPTHSDIVMGIGMNVAMPSVEPQTAWCDLRQVFGSVPSRNAIIGRMLNSLVTHLESFQSQGFPAFSQLWSRYDLLAGKNVELTGHQSVQEGVVHGVNERGELCVKVGNTLKAVRYGEVSVKPQRQV